MASVARKAHVSGGMLEIENWAEGEPPFPYGELVLHAYANGRPETLDVQLYVFSYKKGQLTCNIIGKGSGSEQHPYGITIGRLSISDPAKDHITGRKETEVNTVPGSVITLNGLGTFKATFTRGSDDAAVHIPRAKQTG